MAGAIDDTLRKFHASLNVSDLDRSIAFYRVLLGAEPAKVRSDYAKFDLAEPPLVLSLIPGRPGAGGNLNHVGPARAKRRGAGRDSAPPRGGRAATPSGRKASSAVTRGRRSSGSPIPTARCGRSTSFTTTSTITAAPRRLASEPAPRGDRAGAGTARVGAPAPGSDSLSNSARRQHAARGAPRRVDQRGAGGRQSRGAVRRVVAGAAPGCVDLHPRPGRRSPEPFGARAARSRRGGAARAGDRRRGRRTRSSRIRRDSDREAVGDGVLRRRRRADARDADRGAQAGSPAGNGDAPGGVSRTDGAGHRRLRQRVPSRRADAAQRSRLADAVEERRERRLPVLEA